MYRGEIESVLLDYVIPDIKNIIIEYVGEFLFPNVDYDESIKILKNLDLQFIRQRVLKDIEVSQCSWLLPFYRYEPKHKLSIIYLCINKDSIKNITNVSDVTLEQMMSLHYMRPEYVKITQYISNLQSIYIITNDPNRYRSNIYAHITYVHKFQAWFIGGRIYNNTKELMLLDFSGYNYAVFNE